MSTRSLLKGRVRQPEWVAFGKVKLKIVRGHTDRDVRYLNVYVKHLGRTGFAVGGLLGEDDHEDVSAPSAECSRHMSLHAMHGGSPWPSLWSVAQATSA